MEKLEKEIDGYSLHESIVVGGASSLSPVFSLLVLSSISYHELFLVDTIDEMMSYSQILFVSMISYFTISLLFWRFAKAMANNFPIWAPISVIGSLLFLAIFTIWELRSDGNFQLLLQFLIYSSIFLTIVSAIFGSVSLAISKRLFDGSLVQIKS